MVNCFLSLGSNIGDRLFNINTAISNIRALRETLVISKSSIYESEAMYNEKLDAFYNCVIKITTNLSAENLLLFLKNIEQKLGRNLNDRRYSARTIRAR